MFNGFEVSASKGACSREQMKTLTDIQYVLFDAASKQWQVRQAEAEDVV